MKPTLFAPLAFAALASASASASAQSASPLGGPASEAAAVRISLELDKLDDSVDLALPMGPSIDEIASLIRKMPSTGSLRARMSAHLADFAARTERTLIGHQDVAVLRTEFVLERIESALDDLESRARGGGWTAQQYAGVVESWTARARVFVDAPDPAEFRARFTSAVGVAAANARSWSETSARIRSYVAQQRARFARHVLLQREADGSAQSSDVLRLVDAVRIVRRRRMATASAFPLR